MPENEKTLYVIYNANGSFFGKLQYGYRKMTCNKQQDNPCAACDITHGGLSLNETPAWQEAKRKIQDLYGLPIKQLHLDELTPELEKYIKENNVSMPVVMLGQPDASFEMVMDKDALNKCKGDANAFVEELQTKKVLQSTE